MTNDPTEGLASSRPMEAPDEVQGRSDPDFQHIREVIRRAVSRACPAWLADRRDDITQAATRRVLELSRRNEDRTAYPASYLWKVAYSATIDEIRRLRREQSHTVEVEEPSELSDRRRPSPEQSAAGREIGGLIRACLRGLLKPRRMAVVLHLQGESLAAVGRLLGWNVKRANNLVYRGLADLRECLRAKGVEP